MTPAARLLAPYRRPTAPPGRPPPGAAQAGWRFHDAPPGVVACALTLSEAELPRRPPDGRPPPRWLVGVADRLGGRLAGFVTEHGPGLLRVDGLVVRRARRHDLLRVVSAGWRDPDDGSPGDPGALGTAIGEVYDSGESPDVTWKGPGRALAGRISRGELVGLWWP
ncbi:MAG: hypothetical protein ACFCVG_02015 [Kineosporiaceae bacterium]